MNLASVQVPWTNMSKFFETLLDHGVSWVEGPRHNRTDGEVHYILTRPDGSQHILSANYWDCRLPEWCEALEWVY
jgi:hypothetical protein